MKRRYLEARYDVTGLNEAEVDVLAGEVTAMAEASDRGDGDDHPDVVVELDYTTVEVCEDCGNEIPEGESLCSSCEQQRRYDAVSDGPVVVELSGADVLKVEAPEGQRVEVRQYHHEHQGDGPFVYPEEEGSLRYEVSWPRPE